MDFVLIGTGSRWRLWLPQGCTQQEPAQRKQLVSLAPAFDLRESHATEGRLARSPVCSLCPWRAEMGLSLPWCGRRRSAGHLGTAIPSLHRASEMFLLLLDILTSSWPSLLGLGLPLPARTPAAPVSQAVGRAVGDTQLPNRQGCLGAGWDPPLEKAV